ncbi:MAG: hypothetical protein IJP71_03670 [Lachnospiraceae bacterium]|nr:hypothetical protein [Lachnospiraceae bacterium]
MKKVLKTISKVFIVCILLVCTLVSSVFADLVEIKNGVKTTYADKPRVVLDTINKHYDYKWTLDKKGEWRLYIRRLNGKLIELSNLWVNQTRMVIDEDGNDKVIVDYYYFDYYQRMVTGWLVDKDGNTFFLNTDEKELGRMARGWNKIGENYYFFDQEGRMQKNMITEDGFYVDGEGKWQ